MDNVLYELIHHPDYDEGADWSQREYLPKEVIVREGEQHGRVFLIESGQAQVVVKVNVGGAEKQSPKLCTLNPGDIFGELSLFDDQPSSATIKAMTECHVYEFHAMRLRQFLDLHPDMGYHVLNVFYELTVNRLRQANDRVSRLISLGLNEQH